MKNVFLAGFCFLTTFLAFGQDTPTILFICEHGAGRSTIAAAYFNKLAEQKGLNYRAIFRGTIPDSTLGPIPQKGLVKDGFDVHGWKPAPVTKHDIENAYQVITLDCVLPEKDNMGKPITEWKGIPPFSGGYNAARDTIVKKVQALVVELSRNSEIRK